MQLYFIAFDDSDNGDNHDWFVQAKSPKQALKLWAKSLKAQGFLEGRKVILKPPKQRHGCARGTIFPVPLLDPLGPPRLFEWAHGTSEDFFIKP